MSLNCPSCQKTGLRPLDPADLKCAGLNEGWIYDAYQCGNCGYISSYSALNDALRVRGSFTNDVIEVGGWLPLK